MHICLPDLESGEGLIWNKLSLPTAHQTSRKSILLMTVRIYPICNLNLGHSMFKALSSTLLYTISISGKCTDPSV